MIDPVLGGIIVAGITAAGSVAATLQVQRHTAQKETKDERSAIESSRISDIRAYYDQLIKDRDIRIAELRADLQATEADLRLHNDALLKAATSQEQMVAMMRSLIESEV